VSTHTRDEKALICQIAASVFGDLFREYNLEIRQEIHNGSEDWREEIAEDAVRIAKLIVRSAKESEGQQ
jgi:hypothetical protein